MFKMLSKIKVIPGLLQILMVKMPGNSGLKHSGSFQGDKT
jgi:hypothetical protein